MLSSAMGVTWPIIVLNAKLVMVAIETPWDRVSVWLKESYTTSLTFDRVLVSNISAGTIPTTGQPYPVIQIQEHLQDRGPLVAEKLKL